jgi:glucan biosynthesis protein C
METQRLYFIDRLRFLAVIVLIFFHSALIFAAQSNFPIKNNELSALIEEFVFFIHGWRLGLLFFISGVGTSFALQFRNNSDYIKERLKRLLIPLLFGVLVIVPPQIYFERLSQGFALESFGSFYLQSFSTGFYPYGNISWNHLWFVAYLLIYSLLSVPIFALIKKHKAEALEKIMSRGGIFLYAIPLAIVIVLLKPHSLGVQNIVNDLAMFFFYWLVFLAGFAINQKKYWQYFENKLIPLSTAVVLLTALSYFIKWKFPQMEKGDTIYLAFNFIKAANSWLWILLLLSLGKKYLNTSGKFLPLLNESVYPIYILHQTVIICLGYFVVQQSWSIGTKFFFITFATVIICWLLFLLLRLNGLTRICFGMGNKSCFR